MAEAICRADLGSRPWQLSSAGFFSDHSLPPVPEVLALLQFRGLSGRGLTSMRVSKEIVKSATNIYAMTEMHMTTLKRQFPKEAVGARLVTEFSTLSEYRDQDVPDPMGGAQMDFEEVFTILSDAIPQIIDDLDRDV
jgi:protein-tyrosine-phosphatase